MNRRTFIAITAASFVAPQFAFAAPETFAIKRRPRGLTTVGAPDDEVAKRELGEDGLLVDGQRVPTEDFADIFKLARAWRPGAALLVFRDQINKVAPNRKKGHDGIIGDPAHASRVSDHNPWIIESGVGIVSAIDITDDPAGGCKVDAIVEKLRAAKDARIKFVIWKKRIFNSQEVNAAAAWSWRPYKGSNPHSLHMHMSVKAEKPAYDSKAPWPIA